MPWYLWLLSFEIALHQLQSRKDEAIQLTFIFLTGIFLGGLILSSHWFLHLLLVSLILALSICEARFQQVPEPVLCDRPCFRKSLCRRFVPFE